MNSQVNVLLHVLLGVREDIRVTYPTLKGVCLDFDRLALYCQTRGLGLFTLDLPHLDTLLLRGLESGRLPLEGPLSKAVSKRVRVPRLFSGLWLRVFDRDGCLKPEVDVTSLFFLRQLFRQGKNIEVDCSYSRTQAAVKDYHDIERQLREPSSGWHLDVAHFGESSVSHHLSDCCISTYPCGEDGTFNLLKEEEKEEQVLSLRESRSLLNQVQSVADLVMGAFAPYDPIALSELWESEGLGTGFKHGKGAVSERLPNWEKSEFECWPDKLENVFPFALVGKTAGAPGDRPSRHERPGRLLTVPKTAKSPRLIASEPVAHMYCQQHLWAFIRLEVERLFSGSFLDFKKQSASGDLVLKASLNRELVTVDLSSASDRLSCWTVERIMRTNVSLLKALHAARTRYLRDDVSEIPTFLRLKKFASQGSATNFPVQSLCYLIMALGACIEGPVTWQAIRKLRHSIRVYGDDIIIPYTGYDRLVRIMGLLQLKVNMAKSYKDGHFRESCGVDGYMGHDVTPVSPKTLVGDSPASRQAVVDTINNLFNKGLWHASYSLETTIPPHQRRGYRIVASRDAGFGGLTSASGSDESHLFQRWNSRLHRYEVRVFGLRPKIRKRDRQGFSALLDFVSRVHNPRYPRVVSQYAETWKTRDGFLWEPLNPHARVHPVEPSSSQDDRGLRSPPPYPCGPEKSTWIAERGWCRSLYVGVRT